MSESKQTAIKEFLQAMGKLRNEGILLNKKDFTCQIGEWMVETLYDGKRSLNGIQKGWDVEVNGRYIQVKAHAKAATNNARFSVVNCTSERFDELIIIVFTEDYKLKAFYKVPGDEALKHIHPRGGSQRPELCWSAIEDYKQEIERLPRQDIIKLFT